MQSAQLRAKHNAQLAVMQDAYSENMSEESASPHAPRPYRTTRRERLRQLVLEAGGASDLGRLSDTPKSHISAMLSGARNVGDELATKLEQVMDKPDGWMDTPIDRYKPAYIEEMGVGESTAPYAGEAVTRSSGLAKRLKSYLDWLDASQVPSAKAALVKLMDGDLDEASADAVLVKLDRATALFRSEGQASH